MYSWSYQRKGGHRKLATFSAEYGFNQTVLRVEQKAELLQMFHVVRKFPGHAP